MLKKTLIAAVFLLCIPVFSFSQTDTALLKHFTPVEKEASFPGGPVAWRSFLQKNLNGSLPADNGAPAGEYTVLVRFIVNKDGTLDQLQTDTRLGYGMEEEVIRVLKKSGNWQPAIQKDTAVKAFRIQPVTFYVMPDAFEIKTERDFILLAGKDNPVTVNAWDVKGDDLKAEISKGTITSLGGGRFTVRTDAKPGERVILTIFNAKKKNEELGQVSFEVKAR